MATTRRIAAVSIADALAGAAFLASLVLTASPAGASLTGACQASGTLVSAGTPTRTYNPKVVDTVTVPRAGDVHSVNR
jgi:hypothetical protein